MKNLIKLSDAAELIGVSPHTLRRWINEGRIDVIKSPGGWSFFTPAMIEDLKQTLFKTVPAKIKD